MRQPRILILGLPYFGRMLEGVLRERGWRAAYAPHPGHDPSGWARLLPLLARADVVYLISSRVDRGSPQDLLARVRRRPIAIHWVGTDVIIAHDEWRAGRMSRALTHRATHWCDAPWLADELTELGIRADYVPLPVHLARDDPPPLPGCFRVLLYLPVDAFDREVFDMETLLRLPGEFPDIPFLLIPSPPETLPGPLPPNLQARGWVEEMEAVYRDATVYVRLTAHDGMSFMALEALSRGRYVIWTHPLEGAIRAAGFEAVRDALADLKASHDRRELGLNAEGRRAVLERFDRQRAIENLDARLRSLLR